MVNGSPTKTQMVDGAGGKTQLSQLVAGGFVALVLHLPDAAPCLHAERRPGRGRPAHRPQAHRHRGHAGHRPGPLGRVRGRPPDGGDGGHVGIEQAIILAIVLSIIEHLYHAYKPHDTTLAVTPEGRLTSEPFSSGTVLQARPGLVIYRFGAGLYYANATRFQEEALWILENSEPKVEWFCLSGAAMPDVDYSGAAAIKQVMDEVKRHGAKFVVCQVEPGVIDRPNQYGLVAEVDGVYDFIEDVIEAYDKRGATS